MTLSETFEAPSAAPSPAERLAALRADLAAQGLDGFILTTADEHINEFPPPCALRLGWLTGFTGSTAQAAVLADKAAILVDSRYTEVAKAQVDLAHWSKQDVPQTSIGAWLAANAKAGARIGYDPRIYARSALKAIEAAAGEAIELVPAARNPVDAVWADRPGPPEAAMFVQPIERTGKPSADKRREVGDWLASTGADAAVLVALDSIAWLFNVRGHDIDIVPVTTAFCIVHQDGTADLFVDERKLGEAVRQHLGNSVRVRPYGSFLEALGELSGKTVSVDPDRSPIAIQTALEAAGTRVRDDRDPTILAKAIKNEVEVEGFRQCHIRDGAALTRFLHWFSQEAPKGGLTELSAAAELNRLRRETEGYHSLSFDPISAVGAHAAIPHYWPTPETDAAIRPGDIYLVDSGGQYPDGTTDVTRTVIVGEPTAEMRDRFTRVLKGHIALDRQLFPDGTCGRQLDGFARQHLWQAGLDYGHGTGHGVGAFLGVHEGPQYFATNARGDEPFRAGMVVSNEPGYYKVGAYGIRIENLAVVVERAAPGGDQPMLGFEALTMAPIDRKLIDAALLSPDEAAWLDAYHAEVLRRVGPLVPADTRAWLQAQCAPILEG